MRIAVIDNYDSFVYNLVHLLYSLGVELIDVFKNDQIDVRTLHSYDKILLSPGPGIPNQAGQLLNIIDELASSKSMIGICLGHQAIAESFGGKLTNLDKPLHGITSSIQIEMPHPIFQNVEPNTEIGHYHSWVVDEATLPSCFNIHAKDAKGNIMAISHKEYDLVGLQFHPESILTIEGTTMIKNWIKK